MYKFEKNMKLSYLHEISGYEETAKFLISRSESYTEKLKTKTLVDINNDAPTWDAQSMEDGINHTLNFVRKGIKLDYDFWGKNDKQLDGEKERTKLFYLPAQEDKPFILLCAGGGYTAVCSMVEAFPVAKRINELGYNVFVLSYRIGVENVLTKALEDVAKSLSFIFENSKDFKVSKENYAICGFSAGANLTSEWAVKNVGYGKYKLPKPSAIFLAYPFLNIENTTKEMQLNMFGDISESEFENYLIYSNMSIDYPSTFIVHTKDDDVVGVDNSLTMKEYLSLKGVPHELVIGEKGGHGFGLGTGTDVEGWVDRAVQFWREQCE